MQNKLRYLSKVIAFIAALLLFIFGMLYKGTIGKDRGMFDKGNLIEVGIVILICILVLFGKSFLERKKGKGKVDDVEK